MHVSNALPHMLTSNQRGRGHEPVTVVGNIRLVVAVSIVSLPDGDDGPGVGALQCEE